MTTLISTLFLLSSLSMAGPPADAPEAPPGPGSEAVAPEAPLSPSVKARLMAREADILAMVEKHRPDRYDELVALKNTDPDAYVRGLFRVARAIRGLRDNPELRENKGAQHELMGTLEELAAEHRDAGKKEQKRLRDEMEEVASEIFDLRQAERRMKVEEIQTHLEALQDEIAERDERKDALISDYLDRMLSEEPEGL